jgi:superfamily II DNA/RNA helicase
VANVINFDFPDGGGGVEDYVHRIGRTARGGNSGNSYSLLTPGNTSNRDSMKALVGVLQRCDQVIYY